MPTMQKLLFVFVLQFAALAQTFYIAPTGYRYHYASCRTLKNGKTAISIEEASRRGYSSCGICKPPQKYAVAEHLDRPEPIQREKRVFIPPPRRDPNAPPTVELWPANPPPKRKALTHAEQVAFVQNLTQTLPAKLPPCRDAWAAVEKWAAMPVNTPGLAIQARPDLDRAIEICHGLQEELAGVPPLSREFAADVRSFMDDTLKALRWEAKLRGDSAHWLRSFLPAENMRQVNRRHAAEADEARRASEYFLAEVERRVKVPRVQEEP